MTPSKHASNEHLLFEHCAVGEHFMTPSSGEHLCSRLTHTLWTHECHVCDDNTMASDDNITIDVIMCSINTSWRMNSIWSKNCSFSALVAAYYMHKHLRKSSKNGITDMTFELDSIHVFKGYGRLRKCSPHESKCSFEDDPVDCVIITRLPIY